MYKAVAENSHGKAETEAKVGIKGNIKFQGGKISDKRLCLLFHQIFLTAKIGESDLFSIAISLYH